MKPSHIIVQELQLCINSLEMLINVQAVSAARLTVFSCAGNCLADLEWKQPIIEEMQVMQHSTVPVLELT